MGFPSFWAGRSWNGKTRKVIPFAIGEVIESCAMNEKPWLDDTQPIAGHGRIATAGETLEGPRRRRRGCLPRALVVLALLLAASCVSSLLTGRINVLVLGIDRTPEGSAAGRSDTMILTTFIPARGYAGMLSIPRDLWVSIPGFGENRINAAHFFAEAVEVDSGPTAAVETVSTNFGIDLHYYVRVQFDALRSLVDALGGVTIVLEQPAGGLPTGEHVLDGEAALAFIRNRAGSDDFFRMENGQLFTRALAARLLSPASWPRLPLVVAAIVDGIDTNVPPWAWPSIGWSLLFAGPEGIDGRIIDREMAHGFTTAEGAQVLAPDWAQINPILLEMFGQ